MHRYASQIKISLSPQTNTGQAPIHQTPPAFPETPPSGQSQFIQGRTVLLRPSASCCVWQERRHVWQKTRRLSRLPEFALFSERENGVIYERLRNASRDTCASDRTTDPSSAGHDPCVWLTSLMKFSTFMLNGDLSLMLLVRYHSSVLFSWE